MKHPLLLMTALALGLTACGDDAAPGTPIAAPEPSGTAAATTTEPVAAALPTSPSATTVVASSAPGTAATQPTVPQPTAPKPTSPPPTTTAPSPPPTPETTMPTPPSDRVIPSDPVQVAIADLGAQLGVPAEGISVVSVEEVDWPDGSIGCPQPGMSYTQAIVNGSRIVLNHDGTEYEYHQGGGRDPFYCPPERVAK